MGRHLSLWYGQVILVSGYPVLTALNLSQHWCAICKCQFAPGLPNLLESVWLNIGFLWCGRTVIQSVFGHVIIKFSGMDRFSYPWCSLKMRSLWAIIGVCKWFKYDCNNVRLQSNEAAEVTYIWLFWMHFCINWFEGQVINIHSNLDKIPNWKK